MEKKRRGERERRREILCKFKWVGDLGGVGRR